MVTGGKFKCLNSKKIYKSRFTQYGKCHWDPNEKNSITIKPY